jgi:NodT family efflux transporter outer membrane factor (OMF) lipoprotein
MGSVAASKALRGTFKSGMIPGVPVVPRNFARLVVAVTTLLQCAGCLVGPDFSEPSAPVAEKWLEAGNASVDTRNQEYRNWWKVFHDPVLDRLIETAYNQNLTLVSAGTQVLEARAQLGVAIGEFYPQVQQGNGSVTYIRPSHADTTEFPSGVTRNFWRDALGLTANWELDFWGKFRRAIESADASYLSSIANYDYVLATLLGDVATTYIGIRTLQTQIEIARDNIVKQKKALAIAQAKFQGGTATKLDVYQAENVLAQTESTIPQLTIQLNQGFNALAVLLGMSPQPMEPLLTGSHGIPVPSSTVAVGIPADLVRRRPDIRAAELAAMAQSAQIGIAESNLYPAFSLTGTFGTTATNIRPGKLKRVFEGTGITFAFGPSFQWNILNYGQITNQVRVEDAALQTLLVNYQNAVLQAQQQVENGLTSFLQGREQVDYLRQSVAAANAALGLAFLQYNLGTRDFTTVLTAEQNLYTAQNNLAMAEGNVSAGLASVYEALGGGWQIRADNEFVPAATAEEMRNRTNWGELLPPPGTPQPAAPELPTPADASSSPRLPEW